MEFGALEVTETDVKKNGASVQTAAEVTAAINAAIAAFAATLATVATSGDAADLTGTLPAARLPSAAAAAAAGITGYGGTYSTGIIDFKTAAGGHAFVPANAGFYFVPSRYQILVTEMTGADSTGNLIFQAGNDGSESNLIPSQTATAAQINAGTPPINNVGGAATMTTGSTAEATSAYTLKITTALGTSTTVKGVIVVIGKWVATT